MTIKKYNSATTAKDITTTAKDLEATQLVSLDDFKEMEQLAHASAAERAKPHRTVVAAGIVFGLILAVILLLTMLLVRSGGH